MGLPGPRDKGLEALILWPTAIGIGLYEPKGLRPTGLRYMGHMAHIVHGLRAYGPRP